MFQKSCIFVMVSILTKSFYIPLMVTAWQFNLNYQHYLKCPIIHWTKQINCRVTAILVLRSLCSLTIKQFTLPFSLYILNDLLLFIVIVSRVLETYLLTLWSNILLSYWHYKSSIIEYSRTTIY